MLGLAAYRLRADLRRRWRTALGMILLVAILGGIVLALASGARRTSSAYDRLVDLSNPPELLVSPSGEAGTDATAFYDAVAETRGVRGIRVFAGIPLEPEAGTPSERLTEALSGIGVIAPIDTAADLGIGRPRLVAGRLPDPSRADEILVSQRFAQAGDVHVGDRIDAVVITSAQTDEDGGVEAEKRDPIRLTVTGIGVQYDEVVPFGDLNEWGSVLATPALAARVDRAEWNFEGAMVDVIPGADLNALTADIKGLARIEDVGGPLFVTDQLAAAQRVSDAMGPLAVALAVAAVITGLVALLVVQQAMSKATHETADEINALRAIGARPSDRVALGVGRAVVVGVAGAAGAVVVAFVLSGRFPIGVARVAEPDPGLHADVPVLAGGAVVIVIVTIGSALLTALLDMRRRAHPPRASWLARVVPTSRLSPAAVQGVRFAVAGGGSRAVPLRTTVVAVTGAITAVVATVTFASSLGALVDNPDRYGQGWDRMVDAQFGPAPVTRIIERFGQRPDVRGIGAGNYGDVTVNGTPVPAFDMESVHGTVSVSITEGRPAAADDEIVLGGETIDRLGVQVGDSVDVEAGQGRQSMRVTGRGVFPQMGQGSFSLTGLGVGAQLGGSSLLSFGDFENVPTDYELDGRRYNFVAIDIDGPPNALDAELATLEQDALVDDAFVLVRHEQPPTRIRDLDRVRVVPAVVAALLALFATAALGNLLFTSVRERRRELALLRALGFANRQLRASVSWHASVIALTALTVGIPLGIVLGRGVWQWCAAGLHASAPVETPWIWLGGLLVTTLVVANLLAAVPGRAAARTHPAAALRDE